MNGIVEVRDLETFGPATLPSGGEVEILFTPLAGLVHASAGIPIEPAGPQPDPSDLTSFPATVAAGELEVSLFSPSGQRVAFRSGTDVPVGPVNVETTVEEETAGDEWRCLLRNAAADEVAASAVVSWIGSRHALRSTALAQRMLNHGLR